ncbi:MAG: hypothetical protein ACJ0UT_08015, partial [Candidatus Latescibacterota bacterium]
MGWKWHGAPAQVLSGLEIIAKGPMLRENPMYSPHAATIYDGSQCETSSSTPGRSGGRKVLRR